MTAFPIAYGLFNLLLFVAGCCFARWLLANERYEPLVALALFLLGFLAALAWLTCVPAGWLWRPAALPPLVSPPFIPL